MKHQLPLSLALILICLSFSSCIDNGQSAGSANNSTPATSPSPSVNDKNQTASEAEPVMLKGPNAVPKDTRIIVNIPAFRMDVFRDGTLLKSYKVGIGYQQFPLPTGFRK